MLNILIFALLVGLFLYSKLIQHRAVLIGNALKLFTILDRIFTPICTFISKLFTSRWTISNNGMKLDFSQLILFILLLWLYRHI
jgi:hypothetical protein